jgi:predicted CXXCH cytochrome family protein
MEVEVTFLTRRGSAVMRRSRRVDARRIRFGRGTGNEVQLPDIRVDLTAAALFPRSGVLTIQALGPSALRVNGQTTRGASIGPGDELVIGPYRIQLSEPAPGLDAALSIELVQPLGDVLTRLTAQAQTGLHGGTISKRVVSWTGILIICLFFLVAPIVFYTLKSAPPPRAGLGHPAGFDPVALLWEPGELSNSHRFFASNCASCHQSAFAAVSDNSCLACHRGDNGHAVAATKAGASAEVIGASQCTSCHVEHRGNRGIVISDSGLCLQCHSSLAERLPGTGVRDIAGFQGHPQFRVTLVADAAGPRFERALLGGTPPPTDRPGIKFSHAAHLVPGGFPALGYKAMACADCHKREPGGEGFVPVTYKEQCQRCHALTFDRQELPWPNARVPHGDDTGVAAAVWNYYAGKALQGDMPEPQPRTAPRRIPGAPTAVAAEAGAASAQTWVTERTEAALRTIVFDDKRGCAYCHFGTGPEGTFDLSGVLPIGAGAPRPAPGRIVAPVVLRNRFLPQARFDHARHAAMDCEQCHAARRAETSGTVLIPGVENCQACHGAENTKQRAESTCITCHRFHRNLPRPAGTSTTSAK